MVLESAPEQPERRRDAATKPGGAGPRRGGLGRGLGALIPTAAGGDQRAAAQEVDINAIEPNPYQPRVSVEPKKLGELAASIRTHGVIQPLIVTHGAEAGRYVLIAGERRWRASRLAGRTTVPIIVKEAAPQAMLELALVENVVRADLAPLEEAAAYRQLIDEFGLTQASVAERVGRSRVSVTNTLRLLAAPEQIQAALNAGEISEGHARALLGLPTAADQVGALQLITDRHMTVRQTEELVRQWLAGERPNAASRRARDPEESRLEERFRSALGTKVRFHRARRGQGGTLTIQCFSDEELSALYERLIGEEVW